MRYFYGKILVERTEVVAAEWKIVLAALNLFMIRSSRNGHPDKKP
jgi:hypothetical protein